MTPPSNTPPDGDFVRYLEQLSRVPARRLAGGPDAAVKIMTPTSAMSRPPASPVPAPAPAQTPWAEALARIPFITHLKWVAAAWVGSRLLALWLPGASFLFVPALLGYAAWVAFQVNRTSSGAVVTRLRSLAETAAARAADEVRKAQQATHEKKHRP
ncbi:MAG: hypothetical protein JWQ72_2176 [Polaromonas sp.]|nr:hypothetical protein [Polaromonas sp.]